MQVVHARATFVTPEAVDESLTTIVARSVLEAALQEKESAELWFELESEDGEDVSRLSIDLSVLGHRGAAAPVRRGRDRPLARRRGGREPVRRRRRRGTRDEGRDRDRRHERCAARSRDRAGGGSAGDAAGEAAPRPGERAGQPRAATAQVSSLAAKAQVTLQNKAQVSQQNKPQMSKVAKIGSLKLLRSGLAR